MGTGSSFLLRTDLRDDSSEQRGKDQGKKCCDSLHSRREGAT
jgi:hypothetical protein